MMYFVLEYDPENKQLFDAYIAETHFRPLLLDYEPEWESILESNGYEEKITQKTLTEVFSKKEAERVIRNGMLELNTEMMLIKKWIEQELEQQVSQKIAAI